MSPVCTPRCSAGDAPGLYRQRTPLPPPRAFVDNKHVSLFSNFHTRQTDKLHAPIRRRTRHFALKVGQFLDGIALKAGS